MPTCYNKMVHLSYHEKMIQRKQTELRVKGFRVIRLDRSYRPDLIAIDWARKTVTAVECETSRNAACKYSSWGHRNGYRTQKPDRQDFDETLCCVLNKSVKNHYTIPIYQKALKLRKKGATFPSISQRMGIPITTLCHWAKGSKPFCFADERTYRHFTDLGLSLEVMSVSTLMEQGGDGT